MQPGTPGDDTQGQTRAGAEAGQELGVSENWESCMRVMVEKMWSGRIRYLSLPPA